VHESLNSIFNVNFVLSISSQLVICSITVLGTGHPVAITQVPGPGLDFKANKGNKKFELMLTGRAKAYSNSCPQAVTHRSTNRARRRVISFQPKRVTNYATPPTPVPWRHLVNDIDLCHSA